MEHRKVKSDAQVAMKKNSDPMQFFFFRGGWGTVPQLKFLRTFGIVRNESS